MSEEVKSGEIEEVKSGEIVYSEGGSVIIGAPVAEAGAGSNMGNTETKES
jgi:hypothetical protein